MNNPATARGCISITRKQGGPGKTWNTEPIISLLKERASLYSFLSRIWSGPPSEHLFGIIHDQGVDLTGRLKSPKGSQFLNNLAELEEELQHYVADPDGYLAELMEEYVRLFLGPKSVLVPLWESVYTSPSGLVMQGSTLKVRQIYREYGFSFPGQEEIPDDHLSLELEFLSWSTALSEGLLSQRKEKKALRVLLMQKGFCEEHLFLWAFTLVQKIEKSAQLQFYRLAGNLLTEFLNLEKDFFEVLGFEGTA